MALKVAQVPSTAHCLLPSSHKRLTTCGEGWSCCGNYCTTQSGGQWDGCGERVVGERHQLESFFVSHVSLEERKNNFLQRNVKLYLEYGISGIQMLGCNKELFRLKRQNLWPLDVFQIPECAHLWKLNMIKISLRCHLQTRGQQSLPWRISFTPC